MLNSSKLMMAKLSQKLYGRRVEDLGAEIEAQLEKVRLTRKVRGKKIAITAGSRGIASIPEVLRHIVRCVEKWGGKPFMFPAMGSHGGATAEGQIEALGHLGITEDFVGAPIRATMAVEEIALYNGVSIYTDKFAAEADGIIVVNRIKHHPDIYAPIESGLMKMMAVGMGKRKGADIVHSDGVRSMMEFIPAFGRQVIRKLPVLCGIALLENGYHELAQVIALEPKEIEERERALLRFWKRVRPRLPFSEIDVLIVERMGKDVVGTGMDTKVIGRRLIANEPEPKKPRTKCIVALDLTPASHGNAAGLGLANVTVRRLIDKVDWNITRINVVTSGFIERDRVPITMETDKEAIEFALEAAKVRRLSEAKVVRLLDTNHLWSFYASEALVNEAKRLPGVRANNPARSLAFDADGALLPVEY